MKMSQELIDQLVDPSHATLSAGSNISVLWRCPADPRHIWQASPNTRKRSSGCPVCQNKRTLAGVNDLATTHPDLAGQLADTTLARTVNAGSHTPMEWACPVSENHRWNASVVSRVRLGSGCPYCSGRIPEPGVNDLATTHPDVTARLVDPSQADTVGAGSTKKLLWQCQAQPDHQWMAPVRTQTRAKPTGCPLCTNRGVRASHRAKTLSETDHAVLKDAVDVERTGALTPGSGVSVSWWCTTCATTPHQYMMSVRNRVRGQGCPVKNGTAVLAGVNDLNTTHPELAEQLLDPHLSATLTRGSTSTPIWVCPQGHQWSAPVYARVAGNGCPTCCPIGSSHGEKQLLDAVGALDPGAQHPSVLTTKDGRRIEIDVLAQDLAIEFNGVYWHSEDAGRTSSYHAQKHRDLLSLDLSPFTVWEDDWSNLTRRAVLIRSIAHRLGALSNLPAALEAADIGAHHHPEHTQRLGARTLRIDEVPAGEASAFLEDNHTQGGVALTRRFGLRDHHGTLRALLGLRSAAHNARAKRSAGTWEIQRYATLGIIPGGFTKLLAHAEVVLRDEGKLITQWVSLAAAEVSSGALYEKAGFTPEAEIQPSYWYAGGPQRGIRSPKEAYQLSRFKKDPVLDYEEGWTERQAAQANGLYRVWDAGKTRWIKPVS